MNHIIMLRIDWYRMMLLFGLLLMWLRRRHCRLSKYCACHFGLAAFSSKGAVSILSSQRVLLYSTSTIPRYRNTGMRTCTYTLYCPFVLRTKARTSASCLSASLRSQQYVSYVVIQLASFGPTQGKKMLFCGWRDAKPRWSIATFPWANLLVAACRKLNELKITDLLQLNWRWLKLDFYQEDNNV